MKKAILNSEERHKVHHLLLCSAHWNSLRLESGRSIHL